MPTPEFVLRLREKIGNDLLFLPGVAAVPFDAQGRVLLGQRSDTGRWALVGGLVEPGEQVADALVREVEEETGVLVRADRVVSVWTMPPCRLANGHEVSVAVTMFRCTALSGEARVNDDESLAVGWFALDALPPLAEADVARIHEAAADRPTSFRGGHPPPAPA